MKRIEKYFEISNLIEGVSDSKETKKALKDFTEFSKMEIMPNKEMTLAYHSFMGHLNSYCEAGVLRDYGSMVGNKKCLNHKKIKRKLDKLFKIEPTNWEEVKRWHVKFENIHPFGDGNGRSGRMLMALQCNKLGLLDKLKKPFQLDCNIIDIKSIRREYYQWFKN